MKKNLTKSEAVLALVYEAMKERNTKSGYCRAVNALNALDLSGDEASAVLYGDGLHGRKRNAVWVAHQKEGRVNSVSFGGIL